MTVPQAVAAVVAPAERAEPSFVGDSGTAFLTGNQALVRIVVDAMRRDRDCGLSTQAYVSGYPGSPLGGFDRQLGALHQLLDRHGIVHVPGYNEELAATALAGTQLVEGFASRRVDGVLGVWYGKSPGVDRALDAIKHGQFTGTSAHGGVVMLVGDDPECKSSSLPNSSEQTLAAADVPVLYPGSVREIVELGAAAIEVSRASGLWTALKLVSSVVDGSESVSLEQLRPATIGAVPAGMTGLNEVRQPSVPESISAERDILGPRLEAARAMLAGLNRITTASPDARVGIVAAGPTHYEVVSALERLGIETTGPTAAAVRMCQVRVLHPLDPELFREFARGLDEIVVIEEKRPLLEPFLREALYGTGMSPLVVGRHDETGRALIPAAGALRADDIAPVLAARLEPHLPTGTMHPLRRATTQLPVIEVTRTPFFCSGCPHSTSTRVPEGALVGSGIGCHAIVRWNDPDVVGTVVTKTQMGGEGASWLGIEPFVTDDHLFQNIGDGTFFHSGQLAVQAAVAAGAHITFKLLYNRAIAMTGGQDPAESNSRPPQDVARALLAQGVSRVVITTEDLRRYRGVRLPRGVAVLAREKIIQAQDELRETPGVTVLIHDQECAAERRRRWKRRPEERPDFRIAIDERVCEGCGDCGRQSNCLSLEPLDTPFGRKTKVEQTSCNVDLSCVKGNCPSFVSVRHRARGATPSAATSTNQLSLALPDPGVAALSETQDFVIRMPGIGGTGVVTISQLLGSAATLDGLHVRSLDQTGLSQKAGPVVSDVIVGRSERAGSNRAAEGGVDVYLCFDEIVGLASSNLATLSPSRTTVVSSSSPTPTGQMIGRPTRSLPADDELAAALAAVVPVERVHRVDAQDETRHAVGGTTGANVFLLGVAAQLGLLPMRCASLEKAIEINGVAVQANLAALSAGRRWASEGPQDRGPQTESVPVQLDPALRFDAGLADIVARNATDLAGYQDSSLARSYLEEMAKVARRDREVAATDMRLSREAAMSLHKLMAYKDEYEVARLHLESLDSGRYGADAAVSWHLAPPILTAFGYRGKITVGPWFEHVFRGLYAARRLRGTPFDPFGRTEVRRTERRLLSGFVEDLNTICTNLNATRYGLACELAALPQNLKGFEDVKLAAVREYDTRRAEVLRALR